MKYAIFSIAMLSLAVWANVIMIGKLDNRPATFAETKIYQP